MNIKNLGKLIAKHEDSSIQLKEKLNNIEQLVSELVAFSNAQGGKLIIGVNDKTLVKTGISLKELKQVNQWLANGSLHNCFPPIYPVSENANVSTDRFVVVITIFEGIHKPYCDNNGIYWLRVGSDKRRARPEDIKRLVTGSNQLSVEEKVLQHSIFDNFDLKLYQIYHEKEYSEPLPEQYEEALRFLTNKQLFKGGHLTLAGALLFSKEKNFRHPNFCLKAVSFYGDDKSATEYRDSEDFYGSIPYLYRAGMAFIKRNLPKVQKDASFNSPGVIEIPEIVFEELLTNALIHKDYFYEAPVELLIFDNRIEINNPGNIPAPLTGSSPFFS